MYNNNRIGPQRILALLSIFVIYPVFAGPVFVEPEWLEGRLADKAVVWVDRSSDATQYDRFHIPGARYLDYEALLNTDKKNRFPVPVSDERMVKILGQLGVSRDSYVVLYDDMGGLNVGRFYWHLERLGHRNMSVLNGGLVQWILSGRKVTNKASNPNPVRYKTGEQVLAPKINNLALIEDVKAASKNASSVILDVRSDDEYIGDIKKKRYGHVPGARWWPWQQTVDFQNGFTRADRLKLEQSLQSAGIGGRKKSVIVYCRSGHRAGQTYLTLRSLGYENVRLYANSMNEYGQSRSKLKQGVNP